MERVVSCWIAGAVPIAPTMQRLRLLTSLLNQRAIKLRRQLRGGGVGDLPKRSQHRARASLEGSTAKPSVRLSSPTAVSMRCVSTARSVARGYVSTL